MVKGYVPLGVHCSRREALKYPVFKCKKCGKEYTFVKDYAAPISNKPTMICGACLERSAGRKK